MSAKGQKGFLEKGPVKLSGKGGFTVKIDTRGFKELHKAMFKGNEEIRSRVLVGITNAANYVHRDVKENRLRGNPVRVRSGRLRNSVKTAIDKPNFTAYVGTNMVYARVIERGGTIKPKRSKLLTIPLAPALTKTGASRGTAREVGAKYDATFWRRGAWGIPVLWGVKPGSARKQGARLTPLFVGAKSVTIRKREPFLKSVMANSNMMFAALEVQVRKALKP
jgi:phage gpG-like protein